MTDGMVDPTVGAAMDAIGYDRDIAEIASDGPALAAVPAGGWRGVRVDRELGTVQLETRRSARPRRDGEGVGCRSRR